MNVSNAAKNAIKAYGNKKFAYPSQAESTESAVLPTFSQSQSQAGTDNTGGSARGGYQSRILQTVNPEPVRFTQEEDRLKKIAGVNAIGRVLGSLAQLGGVAAGGDASYIEDTTSPFVMNQLINLDNDYRRQVQQNLQRAFQMDQFNTEQVNRDIGDQNALQAQRERIDQQGQKEIDVAIKRAELALQQFNQKTQAEKEAEMRAIGIDPRDPNAFDKYIQRTNQAFGVDTNYRKSLTADNYADANRKNNPTITGGDTPDYDLETLQAGVDALVSDIDRQIQAAQNDRNLVGTMKQERIAELEKEKQFWLRQYNPKTNPLLNSRVAEAAQNNQQQQEQIANSGFPFVPGQSMQAVSPYVQNPARPRRQAAQQADQASQRSEEEIIKAMNANRKNVIANAQKIAGLDINDPDPQTAQMVIGYAQELVDLGVVDDVDTAIETILQVAQQNAK